MATYELPPDAVALRLYRIVREELIACEAVEFVKGAAAVDTVLRRAALSGRVEIEGEIKDHFADILSANGDMVATVALDRKSYRALKEKWARCKVDRSLTAFVAGFVDERPSRPAHSQGGVE